MKNVHFIPEFKVKVSEIACIYSAIPVSPFLWLQYGRFQQHKDQKKTVASVHRIATYPLGTVYR